MNIKFFTHFLFVLLFSCRSSTGVVNKKEDNPASVCSSFILEIEGYSSLENLHFNEKLKQSMKEKLFILEKKDRKNSERESADCNLLVKYSRNVFNSQISSGGDVESTNNKIIVRYSVHHNAEKIFSNEFLLFYQAKTSNYKYSSMVKDEKELSNSIETISRRIVNSLISSGK